MSSPREASPQPIADSPPPSRGSYQPDPRFDHLTEVITRIGFLAAGSYLLSSAHTIWGSGELLRNPQFVLVTALTYIFAFGMLVLGVCLRERALQRWHWLILLAFLLSLFAYYWMKVSTRRPDWFGVTDAALYSGYAADLLLKGQNPYAWNLTDAFSAYRVSNFYATPLITGEFAAHVNYPALHFLLLVPLRAAGLVDLRLLNLLAHAGTLVLLFLYAPRPLRGLVLLPLVVNLEYLGFATGWVTDPVWAFLLVAMVAGWRRPVLRGVLFGLACSYKQLPWLLIPYLAIYLLLDEDLDWRLALRRTVGFFSLAAGVFVVINGPFMLLDFGSWFSGVFEPLFNPLTYFGSGLSVVTQLGMLPLSKNFYTLMSLVVMLVLLALYVINFRRLKHTLWLFPGLILWVSHRSLESYFVYWVPLLLMAAISMFRELQPAAASADRKRVTGGPGAVRPFLRRRSTQVVVAVLVLAGSLTAWHLMTAQQLGAELDGLTLRMNDAPLVDQITLTIHNTSQRTFTPRIAVQNGSWQPYPWTIESGPESLAPGEEGAYRISTDLPYRMLNVETGGQVVATDASGDYRLRTTLKIEPDLSFLDPSAVFNANYLRVDTPSAAPWGWVAAGPGLQEAQVDYQMLAQNFTTVELSLTPTADYEEWEKTTLSQTILMPEGDILAWIRPPAGSDEPEGALSTAYGLEFSDGQHILWVLFGPSTDAGFLDSHHYYYFVPAEPLMWSQQRIDLRNIYERLGWPLPPLQQVTRNDLQLLARPITVRLLLAGHAQHQPEAMSAQYGPISVDVAERAVQDRVADTIARRWEYDFVLSDLSAQNRNESLADTYFSMASEDAPPGAGDFVLAERAFSNDDYDTAITHFEQAIARGYRTAEAKRGIGWSLAARGDLDGAERYFAAALADNAIFADAYTGLSTIWLQRGRCDLAVRYSNQALAISPEATGTRQIVETCGGR